MFKLFFVVVFETNSFSSFCVSLMGFVVCFFSSFIKKKYFVLQLEGHSSVTSTQREREQQFYMINTSQHQQQQTQSLQQQSKPKRSSSGSSNGSNEKPPQLPPRDSVYSHELPTVSKVIMIP